MVSDIFQFNLLYVSWNEKGKVKWVKKLLRKLVQELVLIS